MLPLNKKNTNWQFTANVTINFHFSKLFITFFHLTTHTLTSQLWNLRESGLEVCLLMTTLSCEE